MATETSEPVPLTTGPALVERRVDDLPHLPALMAADRGMRTLPRSLKSGYLKARDRQPYEFALASAAVAPHIRIGVIREGKVAAGSVGTVPWQLPAGERQLIGQRPPDALRTKAAERAAGGPCPSNTHFKVE